VRRATIARMGSARRSLMWSWLSSAALGACSMPNPAFMPRTEGETEEPSSASESMSSGTDPTGASDTMSSGTGSTSTTSVEPTTTSPGEPTTTSSGEPTTTAGTDATTAGTDATDTEGADEAKLCQDAKQQEDQILLDLYAACDVMKSTWFYQIDMIKDVEKIACPFNDPMKAVIGKFDTAKASGEVLLGNVIGVTPAVGPQGLVEGVYAVDLAGSALPCVAARIGYPAGKDAMILAQVRVGLVGAGDNEMIDLFNDVIPSGQVVEVVEPMPMALRGEKIEIRIITLKELAPANEWTLLWERPRIFEALP